MKVIEIYVIDPQPLQRAFGCLSDIDRIATNRAIQGHAKLAGKKNFVTFFRALEPAT
jgi:hypothetical protein